MRVWSTALVIGLVTLVGAAEYGSSDFEPSAERPVGYRGDGTGRFPAATPPLVWNEATGKNIVWKTRMPGPTTSSPIVVGERVFTVADPGWLVCCDAETGEVQWQAHFLDALFPDKQVSDAVVEEYTRIFNDEWRYNIQQCHKNPFRDALAEMPDNVVLKEFLETEGIQSANGGTTGLPSIAGGYNTKKDRQSEPAWTGPTFAPPCSDGTHVYVRSTMLPVAACYTLDGQRVWAKPFAKMSIAKNWNFRGRTMRVYGDYLYTCDKSPVIIDKRTGAVKQELRDVKVTKNGTMTTLVVIDGKSYILFGGLPDAVLIDPTTGTEAARFPCTRPNQAGIDHKRECDTPYSGVCTIGDTSWMMLGSYPYNGSAMAARYVKTHDGFKSEPLWGVKVEFATWRGGVVSGGNFLVDGINLEYTLLSGSDGSVIKPFKKNPDFKAPKGQRAKYGKGSGECTNNPAANETHIFLPTWTGLTVVIDSRTGEMLHRNRTEPLFGSSPYLHGDAIYLRGVFHLYKIAAR